MTLAKSLAKLHVINYNLCINARNYCLRNSEILGSVALARMFVSLCNLSYCALYDLFCSINSFFDALVAIEIFVSNE